MEFILTRNLRGELRGTPNQHLQDLLLQFSLCVLHWWTYRMDILIIP